MIFVHISRRRWLYIFRWNPDFDLMDLARDWPRQRQLIDREVERRLHRSTHQDADWRLVEGLSEVDTITQRTACSPFGTAGNDLEKLPLLHDMS